MQEETANTNQEEQINNEQSSTVVNNEQMNDSVEQEEDQNAQNQSVSDEPTASSNTDQEETENDASETTTEQSSMNDNDMSDDQQQESVNTAPEQQEEGGVEFPDDDPPSASKSKKRKRAIGDNDVEQEKGDEEEDDDDYAEDEEGNPIEKREKSERAKKKAKTTIAGTDGTVVGDEEDDDFDTEKKQESDEVNDKSKTMSDQFAEILKEIKPRRASSQNDITGLDDEAARIAEDLVSRMLKAAEDDEQSIKRQQPALAKISMLKEVTQKASKIYLQQMLIEKDLLKVLAKWLHLLPNKQLPNMNIRACVLNVLSQFPVATEKEVSRRNDSFEGITVINLKESGIAKYIKVLTNHPKETLENKKKASQLIERWSRLAYQLSDSYAPPSATSYHEPDSPSTKQRGRPRLSEDEETKIRQSNRARVPKRATFDFTKRPKSKVKDSDSSRIVAAPPSVSTQTLSTFSSPTQRRLAKKFTEMNKRK